MDLILYHNACPDGWTAAYICKKKYPEAELVPLNHGLDSLQIALLLSQCTDKDVIMVDYSLRTRELNDQLNAVAESFRILDHHKTAQAALEGADYATFDMKRSGAGLAWDYLFGKDADLPRMPHGEVRPWWVNYAEDQDLWNWALPNSDLINAFLMVQPKTVEAWDDLTNRHDVISAAEAGIGTRAYIEYYTKNVVADLQEGVLVFEGRNYRTAVLNIPYSGVSEAGNAVCKMGYDIGLAWFERGDGITQFSLRSNKEAEGGGVDVSAIAKSHGGGGHRNAAGFQLPYNRARLLVDVVLGRSSYAIEPGTCVR